MSKRIEFTEEQIKFIIEQKKYVSSDKIGELFGISRTAIERILKENNIHYPQISNRKHNLNENFFEKIDSEHKAYWLGFIYADGCVFKKRRTLTIRLKKDADNIQLLEQLKKDLECDYEIKYGKQNSWGTITQYCVLSIFSKKIIEDLIKLGCYNKKSLILIFPSEEIVPLEFQKDFIRGYFDGDGAISYTTKTCHITFCGTYEFLLGVKEFFNLTHFPLHDSRKDNNKNIYYLGFGGNLQVLDKMNKIYKNATIYLPRKYKIFQKLQNNYSKEKIEEHKKYSSLVYQ